MKKKILLLKGASNAEVLRVAADEIALGFQKKGYQVCQIDVFTEEGQDKAFEEVRKEYSFVFAIQGVGLGVKLDAVNLEGKHEEILFTRMIQAPCYIAWIFDDFMYHYFRLLSMNKEDDNLHIFSVDAEMKNVLSMLTPYANRVSHLLHGGFENSKKYRKDIDILYPGNLGKKPQIEKYIHEVSNMPVLQKIADDAVKFLLGKGYALSIREGLKTVIEGYGENWDAQMHYELSNAGIIEYLDRYIRYIYRKQTLEKLLEAGFLVHVVGNGYEQLKEQWGDKICVLGKKDVNEVTDLMARSKIVCNICPPVFKEGAHERIFSAMLNRALCLTPYSDYQKKLFGDYVLFYQINESEKMKVEISTFLKKFSEWYRNKAEEIYAYAKENHTWEKRGEQIVEYYERNVADK